MRILHYFLGFPPYRTGGLTKYAFDLMEAQVGGGNDVIALWPGEIRSYRAEPIVKHRKNISGIENYEIINPLPISLDEGISDIVAYTRKCGGCIYKDYLQKVAPDVIHIHTLMGLHKEFIEAANQLSIRTVYTSHDYFGLCPKVTLYRYGKCCEDDHCCEDCIQCNVNGLSLKKIQIMQSPLYRWAKESFLVKQIRRKHREAFFIEEDIPNISKVDVEKAAEKYRKLRAYYVWMYEHIDFIHFNSTVAETIFKRYIKPKDSKVVSITHKGIKDNRNNLHIESTKFRIVYLAPAKPFKGFYVLKEVLDELWTEGRHDFELKVYSPVSNPAPYMTIKASGYNQEELGTIFSEADVLVAPSVWYETFGFTVLEALSYGVPVIVSNRVGAKDIVGSGGLIFDIRNRAELKRILTDRRLLRIGNQVSIKKWSDFVNEMYNIYAKQESK